VTLAQQELGSMLFSGTLRNVLEDVIIDFYASYGGDGTNPSSGETGTETANKILNILDGDGTTEIEVVDFVALLDGSWNDGENRVGGESAEKGQNNNNNKNTAKKNNKNTAKKNNKNTAKKNNKNTAKKNKKNKNKTKGNGSDKSKSKSKGKTKNYGEAKKSNLKQETLSGKSAGLATALSVVAALGGIALFTLHKRKSVKSITGLFSRSLSPSRDDYVDLSEYGNNEEDGVMETDSLLGSKAPEPLLL